MSTCYESIRKKTKEDRKTFNRLKNYFDAIEQDKIKEYHEKRGRGIDEY